MDTPSVVVRCKNKVRTIERTLLSIRSQTVPAEIVVVDSGSTDGTLEIVRQYADTLIQIPAADFTYGRALNVGAQAGEGEIILALSAHCTLHRSDWIAKSLEFYAQPDVAATNGHERKPDGQAMLGPYYQTVDDVHKYPYWGFSNHASSWRRQVWNTLRFNEVMLACEDKHWAWQVLSAGWRIAYDPYLHVSLEHRRGEGLTALYRRTRREANAFGHYMPVTPLTGSGALKAWWLATPGSSTRPPWVRRLSPYRIAEIAARYVGEREGRRQHGQARI
jgi:rhamnosyltransferase